MNEPIFKYTNPSKNNQSWETIAQTKIDCID